MTKQEHQITMIKNMMKLSQIRAFGLKVTIR